MIVRTASMPTMASATMRACSWSFRTPVPAQISTAPMMIAINPITTSVPVPPNPARKLPPVIAMVRQENS
jgi:hypothetical protein